MALSKIDAVNFLTGTIPSGNVANATLNAVTALPGAIATGKVLQVVTATDTTQRNTSSTSFVTASNTLSVDITPASTSNKIYVLCSYTAYQNVSGKNAGFTLYRETTDIGSGTWGMINTFDVGDSGNPRTIGNPMTLSILDSPSSTSAQTYQLYVKTESGGAVYINYDNIKSSITTFEIAG